MSLTSWALAACLCLLLAYSSAATSAPLIIAHRGSPCRYPEETLEGYELAARHGADYLEMDVVSTSDGQLICRHDLTLDNSTNVGELPQFAGRRWTVTLPDGRVQSGFFAANFTLAEVKQMYARQAFPFRDHSTSHELRVATLAEVLQLAANLSAAREGPLGVYIETKGPSFHDRVGLPLEGKLLSALEAAGYWRAPDIPVVLQSFEEQSLAKLKRDVDGRGLPERAQYVWLLGCGANISDAQLDAFAKYGTGIGPDKVLLAPVAPAAECARPRNATCAHYLPDQACIGRLADPGAKGGPAVTGRRANGSGLVERAHERSLVVHAYTFRNEGRFMALDFASDPLAELAHFGRLGVDGVFVDCPATAREWLAARSAERAEREGGAAEGVDGRGSSVWLPAALRGPVVRRTAAVAVVSVLATLLAITAAWGVAVLIRHRARRRAKYDMFPGMFGNGDLSWYPPDYRRAVIEEHQAEAAARHSEEEPLPTSIMMTPIDSPTARGRPAEAAGRAAA